MRLFAELLVSVAILNAVYWVGVYIGYKGGKASVDPVPLKGFVMDERRYAVSTFQSLADAWKMREEFLEGDKKLMSKLCREQLESTIKSLEIDP